MNLKTNPQNFPPKERTSASNKLALSFRQQLTQKIAPDNSEVKKVLDGLAINVFADKGKLVKTFLKKAITALKKNPDTKELAESIDLDAIPGVKERIGTMMQLDLPVKDHPALGEFVREVTTEKLTEIALGKSDEATAEVLRERLGDPGQARAYQWEELVKDKKVKLNKKQAEQLQKSFALGRLTDNHFDLVKELDSKTNKISDLAAWTKEEWQSTLKAVDDETPNDENPGEYIDSLQQVVEQSYPTHYAFARMTVDRKTLAQDLGAVRKGIGVINKEVKTLKDKAAKKDKNRYRNVRLADVVAARSPGIEPRVDAEVTTLLNSTPHLRAAALRYEDLGVRDIIAGTGTAQEKAKEIERLVNLLEEFWKANEGNGFNMFTSSLLPPAEGTKEEIKWGVEGDERKKLRKQLLKEQRIARITKSEADRTKLLNKGIRSAAQVASMSRARLASITGMTKEQAKEISARAGDAVIRRDAFLQTAISLKQDEILGLRTDDHIRHKREGFRIDNSNTKKGKAGARARAAKAGGQVTVSEEIDNRLKAIPGYEDLFGTQNFCACDSCKSVFSPAAYFVDQMRFIDEYITKFSRLNDGNEEVHVLDLNKRRPDLWSMKLTCENTYKEIPYLQLVNEIKAAYIATLFDQDRDLTEDPTATVLAVLEELVENTAHHHFFDAPASAAFWEMELLLGYKDFDLTVAEVFDLVNPLRAGSAYLGLQVGDLTMPTREIYEHYEQAGPFDKMELPEFLRITGINREDLTDLIEVEGLKALGNDLKTDAKFIDDYGIQFHVEEILGITPAFLKGARRLLLLRNKLGYTIPELGLMVETFFDTTREKGFYTTSEDGLSGKKAREFDELRKKLDLSVAETAAVLKVIPKKSLKRIERKDRLTGEMIEEREASLFQLFFKDEELFDGPGKIKFSTVGSALGEDELKLLDTILAGLRISRGEFSEMRDWVYPGKEEQAGENILLRLNDELKQKDPDVNSNAFASKLFRYRKLIDYTGIPAHEWPKFLELIGRDDAMFSNPLEVIKFYDRCAALPFSLDTLWRLVGLEEEKDTSQSDEENEEKFANYQVDSFFTPIDKISKSLGLPYLLIEAVLRSINDRFLGETVKFSTDNRSVRVDKKIESVALSTFLSSDDPAVGINPNKHAVGSSTAYSKLLKPTEFKILKEEKVQSAIDQQLISLYGLPERLAVAFCTEVTGIGSDDVPVYLPHLSPETAKWLTDFFGRVTQTAPKANPKAFVAEAKWLKLAFESLSLSPESARFIHEKGTAVLGTSLSQGELKSVANLEKLVAYKNILAANVETEEKVAHRMLAALANHNGNKPPDLKPAILKGFRDYFGVTKKEIQGFYQEFRRSDKDYSADEKATALALLQHLLKAIRMGKKLGVSAKQLVTMRSFATFKNGEAEADSRRKEYANQALINTQLIATIRANTKTEERFQAAYAPLEGKIQEIRRDILCAYLLSRPGEMKFRDAHELYAFFLIDAKMSGCMRLSRMVAAHLTLQNYVQRVQMGLEKSEDDAFKAVLSDEVTEQWEWRKNFQVWVANRKVFVYPERYIEPELRDDKSPEFVTWEEDLAQEEYSEENATKAIGNYLLGIEKLGNLLQVGACKHTTSDGKDEFHFFGRTNTQPSEYYYRKLTIGLLGDDGLSNKTWTKWRKLDIAIPSPYVSPIVFKGELYVFWVTVVSNSISKLKKGNSSEEFNLQIYLYYSKIETGENWLQPQKISGFGELVSSENLDKAKRDNFINSRLAYRVHFNTVSSTNLLVKYNILKNIGDLEIDFANAHCKIYQPNLQSIITNLLPIPNVWGQVNTERLIYASLSEGKLRLSESIEDYTSSRLNSDVTERKLVGPYSEGHKLLTVLTDNYVKSIDHRLIINSYFDTIIRLESDQFILRDLRNNEIARAVMHINSGQVQGASEAIHLGTNVIKKFVSIFQVRGNPGLYKSDHLNISEDIYFPKLEKYSFSRLATPFISKKGFLDTTGNMGTYFQELFLHTAFQLADSLHAEGNYKEAQLWYHYVFDPRAANTETGSVHDVWRFLPFQTIGIETLAEVLRDGDAIEAYKTDPFNPHAIARLRPTAYKKTIVRKYLENLLDWGDSLFRKFQFETINEAMMLYVLVQDILGERPQELGKCETTEEEMLTFSKIEEASELPESIENAASDGSQLPSTSSDEYQSPELLMVVEGKLAFCVPMDQEILALWDRVEDRLFKIRQCLNIDGIKQKLSLFAPAIDPRALVAARASGLSVEDAIASLGAALPFYRFHYMIGKAKEFNTTVQSMGGALLSALEKKDVEQLTQLRSVHERNILELTNSIKAKQLEESRAQLENLTGTRANVDNRRAHYAKLIDDGLIVEEIRERRLKKKANTSRQISNTAYASSALFAINPQLGSPFAITWGGKQLSASSNFFGKASDIVATQQDNQANNNSIKASNKRREQEWKHQLKLAEQELKTIDQQIAAAKIRIAIAEEDVKIHQKQVEQAKELYDFYKEKFSSLGLYKHLATALQRLYSQSYNLAFDLAQQAQQCYAFETGDEVANFIKPDNWDTGHAGLLAGERLAFQLNQLEKAFIESNPRREEVRQSVSLRMIDPTAFLNFRKLGSCTFEIPEEVFDLSYPGHYKRRLRTVSITIPCVVGPYTNVPVRFTLLNSVIRTKPDLSVAPTQGPAFANGGLSASSAVNDAGQLELDFRDAKYLPFEGGGAVSEWSLQLPSSVKPFDYNTISDVILNLSYTAEYDSVLRGSVEKKLEEEVPKKFPRLVSVREEFPDIWYKLENGAESVDLVLPENLAPYFMPNKVPTAGGKIVINVGDTALRDQEALILTDPLDETLTSKQTTLSKLSDGDEDIFLVLQYE